MVSIGICGASGCGKSLLVRQLAAKNCTPSLLEGEMGTFPPQIIEMISKKTNPVKLFKWFVDEYDKRLQIAQKLSAQGHLCFVDGCAASIPAHQVLEKPELFDKLNATYATLTADVDVVVLLTLSEKKFRDMISIRGRPHEQNDDYMQRSLKVQNEFLRLLNGKENVLIINRDDYDFFNYDDVEKLNRKILTFAKNIKV